MRKRERPVASLAEHTRAEQVPHSAKESRDVKTKTHKRERERRERKKETDWEKEEALDAE